MNIDFGKLKTILKSNISKSQQVKNSNGSLLDFTSIISNLIQAMQKVTENELAFIIISLQNWITRRENTKYYEKGGNSKVDIGEIFFADLGIAYKPEIAYTHPVIILEKIKNYVLVVPTTTSIDTVTIAYHPIDNPNGDKKYRKIKESEGVEKDCAVILTNITTISQGRLISRKGKLNDINNENSLFNEIKMNTFYYCFPRQYKSYNDMKAEKEWINPCNDIY